MRRDLPEVTQLINARAGTELSPSPLDQLFSKWFPKWLLPGVCFVLSSPLRIRSSRHVPDESPWALLPAPSPLQPQESACALEQSLTLQHPQLPLPLQLLRVE